MSPRFRKGDIWSGRFLLDVDLIGITTNGVRNRAGHLVMGAGIAKEAADRYPQLPALWGAEIQRFREQFKYYVPEIVQYGVLHHHDVPKLFALQTKLHWRDPSDINLVTNSLLKMREHVTDHRLRVHLPMPGVGLGGLDRNLVGAVLEDLLDDRFTIWERE